MVEDRRKHSTKMAMSMQDVAILLSVSTRTVRRWVRDGRLRCCRIGRTIRVLKSDLSEFLRTNGDPEFASSQQLIQRICLAIRSGDRESVRVMLHRLRDEYGVSLRMGDDMDREVTHDA